MKFNWYFKNQTTISIIVSIATIISMILAAFSLLIFVYDMQEQKRIKIENDRIILENLEEEIQYNIDFIDQLQENENILRNSGAISAQNFKYGYASQSLDIVPNQTIRREMFRVIGIMEDLNNGMEFFSNSFIAFPNENSKESFLKLKNQRIDKLYQLTPLIKEYLIELKRQITQINS